MLRPSFDSSGKGHHKIASLTSEILPGYNPGYSQSISIKYDPKRVATDAYHGYSKCVGNVQ